jgi:hypothetical protein
MTLVVVVFDEQFNSIALNIAFELYLSSLVEDCPYSNQEYCLYSTYKSHITASYVTPVRI